MREIDLIKKLEDIASALRAQFSYHYDPCGVLIEFRRDADNKGFTYRIGYSLDYTDTYVQIITAVTKVFNVEAEFGSLLEPMRFVITPTPDGDKIEPLEKPVDNRTYALASEMTKNEYVACELTKAYISKRTGFHNVNETIDIYEKFIKELNARERLGGDE